MNKHKIINTLSILIIAGSLGVWYFLLPKFFAQGNGDNQNQNITQNVQVRGDKTTKEEQTAKKLAKNRKKFDEALAKKVITPQRVKAVEDTFLSNAHSAIAIDAASGTILHYQEGKKRMAIASLTKMMTAIIVVENIDKLDKEIVTVDAETLKTEGSRVGCPSPSSGYCPGPLLKPGEKISVGSLLQLMLLGSANDAAQLLAKHVGGNKEEFVKMMNDKAQELGLRDTHFCNASGLDEDDLPKGSCYSTAYDIARITVHAMKYPEIWENMKLEEGVFYSTDKQIAHEVKSTVFSRERVAKDIPTFVGGKTGYTPEAGYCLMNVAHRPGNKDNKVVAVVLNDPYRKNDIRDLLNWSFSAFNW